MEENEHYIDSIYNYCDRWCERCKYTARCYSFQMDVEDGIDPLYKDLSDEEIWAQVGKRLAQTFELLRQHAAEAGIDLDNLPDVEEEPPSERAARLEAQCEDIHKEYIESCRLFFEENKAYFEEKGQETISWVEMGLSGEQEALAKWEEVKAQSEVIHWYTFFIGVKMRRAIGGLDDMHEDHWGSPEQSDANRTARIVMLAIERSMAAWQAMLDAFPEKEDGIIQVLALLSKFRRMVVTNFPRWAEAGPDVVW
ncbi:MAG: hypothetical protein R2830_08720 [Saprospiraceae bacterium]